MQSTKRDDTEGIVFSDDEDDVIDEQKESINGDIAMRMQENVESIFRTFREFLSTPAFINNVGDSTTNIVDRYSKKCYHIPPNKISKFFKFLEITRRKNLKMMIYEKQLEYSGIMLDFDIKLKEGGVSQINSTHYHRLCINVVKILQKYIHFAESEIGKEKIIHIAFIKKPKVIFDADNNYYKDGLHMLIPGIQITRSFKKLIIDTIISSGVLEKIFREISPPDSISHTQFLDINSAHVGVFFIGSATKINTPPYEIAEIYKVQITVGELDEIIPTKDTNFSDNGTAEGTNICHEFSLNWEKNPNKGGVVKKIKYNIKSQYKELLNKYEGKSKPDVEFENDDYYNEMSILNIHDPDLEFIKLMLDVLHPKRADDYNMWFSVLCALAHTSPSYKSLGEYFSRKSPKFDVVSFEKIWDSILSQKNNRLSIGSIHYWARLDNPDRYEEIKHRSLFTLLYKKIYDPQIEGNLEHYDIAEILFQVLKNKYVFDRVCGVPTWYEFILENEPMKTGELYKWRAYHDRPNSIMKYISTVLPSLFRKVMDKIKSTMDDCNTDLAKYHYQIYKNFQKSCRMLKNSGFKRSVGVECEQLFEQIGFSDKLDADPTLKGVANGILMLGKKCKLIQGYHGYFVSKYTDARFKPMDPHEPLTKKILIALRNLFPDNEPDTFDYVMHYLASTLDGHKKESIMVLLVGKGSNGKSFLVELHKGAIGSIYGVKMPLSFLTSKSKDAESATPALMQLKDAHFAYYSESNKFEVLNMAKIKEFTGQETLAGRKLHQDYVNFKPKCHHLVTSNNDFEIYGTDHGTWRRIDYLTMKIKFCNPPNDDYDPNNPYERKADPSLGSKWAEDDEVLERYLGILVYYYESLLNNYGGKVRNVPHPHIRQETEQFRNRQDRVNNFLNATLVKCSDENTEIPLTTVIDKYIKWYEAEFPGSTTDQKRHAKDQLENSKIQNFIKKTRHGSYLKGYRILGIGELPDEGEEMYIDIFERENNTILNIKPENAEEYIKRLCNEYDNKKKESNDLNEHHTTVENIQTMSESDDDIESMINDNKKREPVKTFIKEDVKHNIDKNGIITHTQYISKKDVDIYRLGRTESEEDEYEDTSTEEESV